MAKKPGLAFLIGLIDRERRLGEPFIVEPRQADQMAVGVDVVFVGLAQCPDAILEHRATVAKDQRRRQVTVEILSRDDPVTALPGKQPEPFVIS